MVGNHDSIRMVPELEKMGIRILFNECVAILQAALLGWGPNEYMTISGNIAPAGFPKSAPGSSVREKIQ